MAGVTMLFLLALASGLAAGRLLRGSSDRNGPIVLHRLWCCGPIFDQRAAR
jgi:hypothetical protein